MKKSLFFLGCIALAVGNTPTANAQMKITPEMVKNMQVLKKNRLHESVIPVAKTARTAKTTAAGEPLLSRVALVFDGANFVPQDSSHFSYSGGRTCYQVDYDDSLFYDRKELYAFDKGANKYFLINTRTASYLSGNYTSSKLDSTLDVGTSDYTPASRVQNTYDAAFNITGQLYQDWDVISNTWVNTYRYTNTYDAANRLLTAKSEDWIKTTGVWENVSNSIKTYNSAGSVLTATEQLWDIANAVWISDTKYTYTYDASERELTREYELFDFSVGALVKQTKSTKTYTASGKIASVIYQNWKPASSAYVNDLKTLNTYDASDRYTQIINQLWNAASSTWVNEDRSFDFTYNTTGKITFYNYYRWVSSAWQVVGRYKVSYDAADRVLTFSIEEYIPATASWFSLSNETSTYNTSGDRLSFVNTDYDYTIGDYTTKRNRSTYNGSHQLTRTVDDHSDGSFFYYKKDDYLKRYHYTETPTSIEEDLTSNTDVSIYPVPANEECTIAVNSLTPQNFSIVVYDIAGHIWQQETHSAQTNYTGTINTKQLPAGNYFVNVQITDGSRIVKAISVMH